MTAADVRAIRAIYVETPTQFARRLGVARSTVYRWESDGDRSPTGLALKALRRLAKKRGVTLSD